MASPSPLPGMKVAPPTSEETVEGPDSLAEEIALSTGRDLKSVRTKRELDKVLREGRVETHLHRVVVCALYVVAAATFAMFVVLVWHYVTPYPFLKPEQLVDLKQLLFSGFIGAFASNVGKKYLGLNGPKEGEHKD